MLRASILECRLAASQHLLVLLLSAAFAAVLAWGQEPWFLRSSGLQLLWHGSATAAMVCFLVGTLFWSQQATERLAWSSGRGRGVAWLFASGLGLTLFALTLVVFGIIVSSSLDLLSGIAVSTVAGTALLGGQWLLVAAPLAFLAPGLAFLPWPASARTAIASSVLAGSASCLAPTSNLDPAPFSGNLPAALFATLGSLCLSAALQRAFSH